MVRLRPELGMVITESNRSLLDRVQCRTLRLERGELAADEAGPTSRAIAAQTSEGPIHTS